MMLKFFFALFFSLVFSAISCQTKDAAINWKHLIGKWKLEKSVSKTETDSTVWQADTVSVIYSFLGKAQFTEESSALKNTVFRGMFHVNEAQRKISFTDVIQTTTFPGTTYKDFVSPSSWPDLLVVELKGNRLVLTFTSRLDTINEEYAEITYYLQKIK